MYQLPTYKGWTIDTRLKQFRRGNPNEGLTFLDFNTAQGDELLAEFIDTLDWNKQEDKLLLLEIWE